MKQVMLHANLLKLCHD